MRELRNREINYFFLVTQLLSGIVSVVLEPMPVIMHGILPSISCRLCYSATCCYYLKMHLWQTSFQVVQLRIPSTWWLQRMPLEQGSDTFLEKRFVTGDNRGLPRDREVGVRDPGREEEPKLRLGHKERCSGRTQKRARLRGTLQGSGMQQQSPVRRLWKGKKEVGKGCHRTPLITRWLTDPLAFSCHSLPSLHLRRSGHHPN